MRDRPPTPEEVKMIKDELKAAKEYHLRAPDCVATSCSPDADNETSTPVERPHSPDYAARVKRLFDEITDDQIMDAFEEMGYEFERPESERSERRANGADQLQEDEE